MPKLLIHIVGDNWVADVANTNVRYTFAGEDLQDQETVVRGFAETMADGNPNVADFFIDVEDPEIVGEQLFGTTDGIVCLGENAFDAAAGETLMDVLVEAGEWLGPLI